MPLVIDERLLGADGKNENTENYNRILKIIDQLQTDVSELTERVTALEGTGG